MFKVFFSNQKVFYQIADLFSSPTSKQFFNAYLKYKQRQYENFPIENFLWNKQSLEPQHISDSCYQLLAIIQKFSSQLDYFYTFYRVRNYIGKGLALYDLVNLTTSPFLDYRVVLAGARLNKKYKLNNFFSSTNFT